MRYDGRAHLAALTLGCAAALAACAPGLRALAPRELWLVPVFFGFANLVEWALHRGPMHRFTRAFAGLHRRHVREHHAAFTGRSMAIRTHRDLQHVLFPPWLLPALLALLSPVTLALAAWSRAHATLFLACAIAYYLAYEWLHALHHAPPERWPASTALARALREHHARHHDPARMHHGNFNVSFPLWDVLLGTVL